jgi:dipeptidyl aminopeptidase/acylaminoacyl peptidase
MKRTAFLLAGMLATFLSFSQKKPLDHSVYDGWQNIGERSISNDGKFVVYAVNPQEGDGVLVIQATDNSYKKEVPRGYNAAITDDSRFLVFRIRPLFKDTRDARIKKKSPDQMPKDSLAIVELGKDGITKIPRVKSYRVPDRTSSWLAYHLDKSLPEQARPQQQDSLTRLNNLLHMADSLVRIADSLRNKATEAKTKGMTVLQSPRRERPAARPAEDPFEEGTELVLRNLVTGAEKKIKLVSDYYFSRKGNVLLLETTRKTGDSLSRAAIVWVNTATGKMDTVMKKFNDAKNYAIDEEGTQLAFVAERDSVAKALTKFYKLWYFKPGMDSAQVKGDRNTGGIAKGYTISPDYVNIFSKDGRKLYIGLSQVRPVKDTSIVDFETARLDIWNYKDDFLQPQQLVQLGQELRRSYLAVINDNANTITPLADESCETVLLSNNESNNKYALGISTKGYRVQQQWEQNGLRKLYVVNTEDGTKKPIQEKVRGFNASISAKGGYVLWYDYKQKNWFTYNTSSGAVSNITKGIKVPLYDEEDDHPDDPPAHGFAAWHDNDRYVYLYDKYDIWQCDPSGAAAPVSLTNGIGRKKQYTFRYNFLDRENRYVKDGETILLDVFDNKEKGNGWVSFKQGTTFSLDESSPVVGPVAVTAPVKAKNADMFIFAQQSPSMSANIYSASLGNGVVKQALQLSKINPQQDNYNWYTVELRRWKMLDGKMSEGLLFKPEDFDSTKKYPIIFYFYERDADTRYNYRTPAPSASTINIAWFTSNGYLVFDPNIYYKNGQPGESAYNSVVSAANMLKKFKWVDSSKMAIQGQSWGGYQVAYLVTRTNMFAAAGAGAPVANMTSAYGGIRWGTGISRQFQYERSQTRIGATPWQRLDLYIKNSPLFQADKVKTPLLITHNDADGAVPWWQGIEYFSALKRLDKKVWLLQYNGEDHNLVERRNRKDLSVRLGQFFGYLLKGEKPARWITDGVPATLKGIDWGITEEVKRGF